MEAGGCDLRPGPATNQATAIPAPSATRRIGALLLRLFAASALLLLARPWAITAGIGSRGMVARQLAAAPPSQAAILPTAHSGVHRYSIPGEFDKVAPAKGSCKRAGVLHIYLKALRWPVSSGRLHPSQGAPPAQSCRPD